MLVKKVMQEMNDLIEHHQLQVISLEEMLEEERQAARMNENAANHVIAELRKEISRYREAYSYLKSAIEFDRYVCHEKCQDVVSVKELEEGLLLFEALEESE